MAASKVYLVHLRRPDSATKNPDERRDDPFYEFGSFGCTKCHSTNLLHPNHAEDRKGARLAFVQGGRLGSRLVFLTPPITIKKWADNCEARWTPAEMPFKYKEAPILVSNDGLVSNDNKTGFPLVRRFALQAGGRKIEGRLSSRIRSRVRPLEPKLAREVVKVYEAKRRKAPLSALASTYDNALPWKPPKTDRKRKATYQFFIAQRQSELDDADGVLHAKPATQKAPTGSRCGLSQCQRSKKGLRQVR